MLNVEQNIKMILGDQLVQILQLNEQLVVKNKQITDLETELRGFKDAK